MPELSLICAMDNNRLIGSDNALPWHLPADLAFFKRTTMGKPILMGRKTYQSIGKPLPGRQNIVISRDRSFSAPGCDVCPGIDAALKLCKHADEAMLIGGASLYQQTLGIADSLYITLIDGEFSGDTWFPEVDLEAWRVDFREDFSADASNPYNFSFVKYVREI